MNDGNARFYYQEDYDDIENYYQDMVDYLNDLRARTEGKCFFVGGDGLVELNKEKLIELFEDTENALEAIMSEMEGEWWA